MWIILILLLFACYYYDVGFDWTIDNKLLLWYTHKEKRKYYIIWE